MIAYYTDRKPDPDSYNDLRIHSGMGGIIDPTIAKNAMDLSLLVVTAYDEDHLIGMGRIIGDGGITFGITDIMVDRSYQRQGIANEIMNHIDSWLEANSFKTSFVMLLAKRPADRLYLKHRFQYIDESIRAGMLRIQD